MHEPDIDAKLTLAHHQFDLVCQTRKMNAFSTKSQAAPGTRFRANYPMRFARLILVRNALQTLPPFG